MVLSLLMSIPGTRKCRSHSARNCHQLCINMCSLSGQFLGAGHSAINVHMRIKVVAAHTVRTNRRCRTVHDRPSTYQNLANGPPSCTMARAPARLGGWHSALACQPPALAGPPGRRLCGCVDCRGGGEKSTAEGSARQPTPYNYRGTVFDALGLENVQVMTSLGTAADCM